MRVLKRTGEHEAVSFDKVLTRIRVLSNDLSVDIYDIAQKVCSRIYDGVKTSELDELAAQICSSLVIDNPDYGVLASRLTVSNHQKNTSPSFSETILLLYDNRVNGERSPLISDAVYEVTMKHKEKLNSYIDYERDYTFDYFGFKTLERSYLIRLGDKIIERPQHMFMRVALGIHTDDVKEALQTYDLMSKKYFTHATPTLFNSGTVTPQLSSCYLVSMIEDSIDGIFDTVKECARISKYAGGIGLHVHNVRAKGSRIRSTNGMSDGLVPMLKVFNHTARYINQSGKRNGSIAVYLEPWHADVEAFLDLKKNHGSEEERARDLFYALWVPDLFMERVKNGGAWSLMCPDKCPGLSDVYGEEFVELYERYEREGRYLKQVPAQQIWFKVLECQIETGVPYVLFKDASNKKSNQKNLGTIKSSNLCVEIIEYSDGDETAVCLTGDTEILTESGIRQIKDIKGEQVLSYFESDEKLKIKEKLLETTLIDNGIRDVYEIKFVGTRPIKATANHKFLVYKGRNYNKKINKYEWMKLKDLSINDRIVMPSTAPLPDYEKTSIEKDIDEEYLTVGWMMGDGWQRDYKTVDNYDVCFGPNEAYAQEKVLKKLNEIHDSLPLAPMGHHRPISSYANKSGVVQWNTGKKSFVKYFQDNYGLMPKLGKDKTIPKEIKESEPTQIASFLSGLFSADGSVYLKLEKKQFYVSLSSASEQLLFDTQSLLRCFGIKSRVFYGEVKSRQRSQGRLSIYDRKNIARFHKYINFMLSKEKQDQLLAGMKTMNYEQKIMEKDWCAIKSIAHVGREKVYDLSVPESHNFVANGLVSHNCNLASLCLPTYVATREDGTKYYDFDKLHEIVQVATKNLNKVIDVNYYPIEKARRSNLRHRPIGIGIQGLADTYILMGMPFDSEEAAKLNKDIFETIYHASIEASMLIAKKRAELIRELEKADAPREAEIRRYLNLNEYEKTDGAHPGAYSSFEGSPASLGMLQFDLWGVKPHSDRYDWDSLKTAIKRWGMRNSLLVAPMPTASTSQIMGFTESFECISSNLYKRKTLAGEFVVVNKYLIQDLIREGLWNKQMRDKIMLGEGSIQNIPEIPEGIRALYKTVWEISQKVIIDQSADRGPYICQSQSLNIFIAEPDYKKLTSMLFYSWNKGLKSGSYYIRSKPRAKTQQFTIDPAFEKSVKAAAAVEGTGLTPKRAPKECVPDEDGVCHMCSA